MGMFDDVINDGNIICPGCSNELEGLQSKDGECELQELTIEEVFKQSGNNQIDLISTCKNSDCPRDYVHFTLTRPSHGYEIKENQ